jgi:hypothetical protein
MTPKRFQECLHIMRLSRRDLARVLGCSPGATRHWSLGERPVPQPVADWLEDCVEVRGKYPEPPPPQHWRAPHVYSTNKNAEAKRKSRAKQRETP